MKPISPTIPHLIIMVGIPGAGKTTFAEKFAKTFAAPFINSGLITQLAETSPEIAQQISLHQLTEVLKTGKTVIYEGITTTKTSRQDLKKLANDSGYIPLLVWVQTETNEAKRRSTNRRHKQPLSPEEFDRLVRQFKSPTQNEELVVISGKHTYTSQLKTVLKRIADRPRTDEQNDDNDRTIQPRSSRPIIVR